MEFLVTTVPGLETVAADELRALLDVDPTRHHRGALQWSGTEVELFDGLVQSRTCHRFMLVVARGTCETLADAYDLATEIDVGGQFEPGQSFGVDCSRHGSHEFTSVDAAERIGQAIVDESRAAFGSRLPVDLDDPDVAVQAYVRDDRLLIALDATGRSLHKRAYRECEHDAPLRPTIGAAMLRLADYGPDDDLLDPMCGSGTLPIEAVQAARGASPIESRAAVAGTRLRALSDDGLERARERHTTREAHPAVRGVDREEKWVRCARVNCRAAGLADDVDIAVGDATEIDVDADVVAVNLPFGIRTAVDLRRLYEDFADRLRAGSWERFVAFTTSPELLPLSPTRTVDVRYGRLEATVVVVER